MMADAGFIERLKKEAWPLHEDTVLAYVDARERGAETAGAMLLAHFGMPSAPEGSIAGNAVKRWAATLDAAWDRG